MAEWYLLVEAQVMFSKKEKVIYSRAGDFSLLFFLVSENAVALVANECSVSLRKMQRRFEFEN